MSLQKVRLVPNVGLVLTFDLILSQPISFSATLISSLGGANNTTYPLCFLTLSLSVLVVLSFSSSDVIGTYDACLCPYQACC